MDLRKFQTFLDTTLTPMMEETTVTTRNDAERALAERLGIPAADARRMIVSVLFEER